MNKERIAALNEKFSIAGKVRIVPGNGGLPRILIATGRATAEIYLHGAQITSWQPAGMSEVLFVSAKSQWTQGKAIRGGIPICFPWFRAKADDPHAPSHGFVRTKEWKIQSISEAPDGSVGIRFLTDSDEASRKWWPFEFVLAYEITVGKTLQLELKMKNTGDTDLKFEEALHTYFKVGDVRCARVRGLDGLTYSDNRDGNREKIQRGEVILEKQTDNAYKNATGAVEIIDVASRRLLRTAKENSSSTIVWNPSSDGATGMADLGREEWKEMLCVEGGNILAAAVSLPVGISHTMKVSIESSVSNFL